MTAHRTLPNETIADITLADFRHLIDHLLGYGEETTHRFGFDPSPPPPPPFALAPPPAPPPAPAPTAASTRETISQDSRTIRGGKIFCNGEGKLHGRKQFAPFDFTPAKRAARGRGHVSPISKRLGMPLLLWQDPDARYSTGPIGSWDNTFATFLMMNTDPASQDWAWAPMYWQTQVGSVLVLREDGKDRNLEDLAMMAYFAQCTLQEKLLLSILLGRSWRRNTRANLDFSYDPSLKSFDY